MNILSLQSSVTYGHVGNSAAVLPLQRMGFDVWPVNTVQFSNHTGHGQWTGEVFSPMHVRSILAGLSRMGVLNRCDAILSGYLGEAETGRALVETVQRIKSANPAALYLCDPVMGDDGGFYVRDGIPAMIADHAVPLADIITPNHFELRVLSGQEVDTPPKAVSAARTLLQRGPKLVIITGFETGRHVASLAVSRDGVWITETPRLFFPTPIHGTGDTLAALILGHRLSGAETPDILRRSVSGLYHALDLTRREGRNELALVASQDQLIRPPCLFPVRAWDA